MSLFTFGLGSTEGGGGITNSAGHAYPPVGEGEFVGYAPGLTLVQGPIVCAILPATVSVAGRIPIPFPPYGNVEPQNFVVPSAEERIRAVLEERRFIVVGAESRMVSIRPESRYVTVKLES